MSAPPTLEYAKPHEEYAVSPDLCSDEELRMMVKLMMDHFEIEMVEMGGYGVRHYRLAAVRP